MDRVEYYDVMVGYEKADTCARKERTHKNRFSGLRDQWHFKNMILISSISVDLLARPAVVPDSDCRPKI